MKWTKDESGDWHAERPDLVPGQTIGFRITTNHDLGIAKRRFHDLSKKYQLIIGWRGGVTYYLFDSLKEAQFFAEEYL